MSLLPELSLVSLVAAVAFLHGDGRIGTDRQDGYVRALTFDLLEEAERGNAADSHTHFAFGAVAEFLVGRIAGLRPGAPGWRQFDVAPLVDGLLTSASATLMTPLGRATSSWQRRGCSVTLELIIPPGATARVRLGRIHEERPAGTHTVTATVDGHPTVGG